MKKILLLALFFLSGCSDVTGEQHFQQALAQLEQLLYEENWPRIEQETSKLATIYEKQKWKIQLLGDEDEYESLQEALTYLQSAASLQEKSDCYKELATIRAYLRQIFRL